MQKISELMGFPFELWLAQDDDEGWQMDRDHLQPDLEEKMGSRLAYLLNHIMEVVINERENRPYTDREVSLMSRGEISERTVTKMRNGELDNPDYNTLLAVSEVFDIDPAYWFSKNTDAPALDSRTLGLLRDKRNREILEKGGALNDKEKAFILDMMDRVGGLGSGENRGEAQTVSEGGGEGGGASGK